MTTVTHETIEQRLRQWCSEMRADGYTMQDIFCALLDETKRIDELEDMGSEPDRTTQVRSTEE